MRSGIRRKIMNASSHPFAFAPASFDPAASAGAGAPPGEGATPAAPGQQPSGQVHFPNSAHANHFAAPGSKENRENGAVSLLLISIRCRRMQFNSIRRNIPT